MTFDDFIRPSFLYAFTPDQLKTEEQKKQCLDKVKYLFEKLEKRYVDLGKKKYFLGDKFTLADIYVATTFPLAFDLLKTKDYPCKEIGPNLGELIKRIRENELKEFFEKYYVK